MKRTRIFHYSGNVDEKYKEEAKLSLINAGWIPVDGEVQTMECSGPDRQTCKIGTGYPYTIVAQRDE
jgi:hypothetical protein